jgi:hypothetical protein
MEISSFLKMKLTVTPTKDSWCAFARNGNLFGLEWMHFAGLEGCTTQAIDWAAEYGYLNIFQRLQYNATKGCTTTALVL